MTDLSEKVARLEEERNMWMDAAARMQEQRDAARTEATAERDGNREIREKYGARPDETFGQFVGRLARERGAARACAEAHGHNIDELSDSLKAARSDLAAWKRRAEEAIADREVWHKRWTTLRIWAAHGTDGPDRLLRAVIMDIERDIPQVPDPECVAHAPRTIGDVIREKDAPTPPPASPCNDDLERVNCDKAGSMGHLSCGWCPICNRPHYQCGHRRTP